ncbi:hypothetical protein KY290_008002 [Solanum tuberosum]|uniref:Uncharacterized protein n=1 Tax=Solanum tuberosum TaxID=4113 RepID=A0ABQ7W762_SOLTU|nr:hypothetical protein KY290_008002 [Solanum tuberosum]
MYQHKHHSKNEKETKIDQQIHIICSPSTALAAAAGCYRRLLLFGVAGFWWLAGRSYCSPEKQHWRGEEEQQPRCCCWFRWDEEGLWERGGRGAERRGERRLLLFSPEIADSDGWLPRRRWRTEKRQGGREDGGVQRI